MIAESKPVPGLGGANVFLAETRVLFGRHGDDLRRFGRSRRTGRARRLRGVEQLLEDRDAPAAAGPRAQTLRHLARTLEPLPAGEAPQLAIRHVVAVADLIVRTHNGIIAESGGVPGGAEAARRATTAV